MHQPLTLASGVTCTDSGAKPKLCTSTPLKFKADDSVFSPLSSEDGNIDKHIKSQLQKIKEINAKYDGLTSSSLQRVQTPIDFKLPPSSISATNSETQSQKGYSKITFSLPNLMTSANTAFQFPNLKQSTNNSSSIQLPV